MELEFINEVREEMADTITRMNALREAGNAFPNDFRRDAIAGEFIDCASIVVDFVDEDLVDMVHDGIHGLGVKILGKRRKSHHVAEHDSDLFPFSFDLVSLGEDLLGDALGNVFFNLGNLLFKGKVFGGR